MKHIWNSIKVFWDKHKIKIVLGVLIFLTATTSFALGYLMGRDQSRAPIIIEQIDRRG